jgi:hypothetical protein
MRNWIVAIAAMVGVLFVATVAHAASRSSGWTWSMVFRVPRAEALGAAVGAAVAVNVGAAWSRRRRRNRWRD